MAAPELIIPVRLDAAGAAATLAKLGAAARKAAQDTSDGADKSKKSFGGLTESILASARALGALGNAREVFGAIRDRAKEASEYVGKISKDFINIRRSMQRVAALTGRQNTNEFTIEQARSAASASISPQEWIRFQEQFQSYAGAYLVGDQQRLGGKQAEDYQRKIAEFAKARGINAETAAQLGGGLLQFSEGPQDVDKLLERMGRVSKTLERAPTPVEELLTQMTRVTSKGVSPEESAQMLALMSEAAPHEEEVFFRAILRSVRALKKDKKGAKFGLKDDMTPYEEVVTFAKSIEERRASITATHGKKAAAEAIEKILKDYAPDERERSGIIGFLNRGAAAGGAGFKRVKGYATETPADFVKTALNDYEASLTGKRAKEEAEQAASQIERGAKWESVDSARLRAKTELTREGRFEQDTWPDVFRRIHGSFPIVGTGVSTEDQLINERTLATLRRQARGLRVEGVKDGDWNYSQSQIHTGGDASVRTQDSVNKEIRDLLRTINAKTPPLTAPPPGGDNKRQG